MELVRVYRNIRNRVQLGEDQGTLADMLLAACAVLERNKLLAEAPFELVAWWEQHADHPADTIKAEERKQQALAKLTREDRVALGLSVDPEGEPINRPDRT